ncbi:MAG: methyltransferase regulatory domain-containing protein [Nitrosomonas sp.]|uniref:class I SAM-dependent methyltransferase n=1 Tax=Nitrosomonas sp. TaxID=42353 RepID=UPI001DC138BF|nr:class I SAM-dependent methyltransferase [Nitrosomonas sp.]MBX9895521.1 methyltransferase regulatory domain-containing protein [Nitrosomonas sp.]
MTDWTAGYVADIGYTYGYYTELNPQRLKLPFLATGQVLPEVGTACELGFGQGISIAIHAAASQVSWYGTDFNPSQAGFAQEITAAAGANATLYDQAFEDFCSRADLPEFDYIGLHGIWSWINDQNRHVITDFLRRKLKIGGVLYISYNSQPGWAGMVPMRELLNLHTEVMGASGQGITNRIDAALDFVERMLATDPLYSKINPQAVERIKRMKEQNRHYLAHEYFNRDWHPMSFARMSEWISAAKLGFACSAHYTDHVDAVNLSAEQQALLQELPDATFRQSVRDFMCNTQFRRDYWVKGERQLGTFERGEQLRAQRVLLTAEKSSVELKVGGARGEATLNENVYRPILDLLADHKPRSLGQIEHEMKTEGLVFAQVLQAVMILTGKGDLGLVQEDTISHKAKRATDKLNLTFLNKSRSSNDIAYLASPVTGGGISVNRFQQLFLLARNQGLKQPQEWAKFVWQHLEIMNQRLTKEGKSLSTSEENIVELTHQAVEFSEKRLPILKALQIA